MQTYKIKELSRPNLLIVFQSMNQFLYKEENADTFEFEKTLSRQEHDVGSCDYLFIKDNIKPSLGGGWYVNPHEKINKLKKFLLKQKTKYNKICTTGTSAGGFASILYGSLCNVDLVLALDPQTILFDLQSNKKFHKVRHLEDTFLDCKPHINNTTKYFIYNKCNKPYNECDIPDKLHHVVNSQRLENFPNVEIINYGDIGSEDWKSLLKNNGF
jgi:hypothetical protein